MTFREQFGKAEETSESLEVDFFFVNWDFLDFLLNLKMLKEMISLLFSSKKTLVFSSGLCRVTVSSLSYYFLYDFQVSADLNFNSRLGSSTSFSFS